MNALASDATIQEIVVSPGRLLDLIQREPLSVGYMYHDLLETNALAGVDVGKIFSDETRKLSKSHNTRFFSVDVARLGRHPAKEQIESLSQRGVKLDAPAIQIFAGSRSLMTIGQGDFPRLSELLKPALGAIDPLTERTPAEIAKLIEGKRSFILNIHTAWCSDCAEQRKNIQALHNQLTGSDIPIYSMLAQIVRREFLSTEHQQLCSDHSLSGYPFLILFNAGEKVSWAADICTEQDLRQFGENTIKLLA